MAEEHFLEAINYITSKFNDVTSEERKYKADPLANIGFIKIHQNKY